MQIHAIRRMVPNVCLKLPSNPSGRLRGWCRWSGALGPLGGWLLIGAFCHPTWLTMPYQFAPLVSGSRKQKKPVARQAAIRPLRPGHRHPGSQSPGTLPDCPAISHHVSSVLCELFLHQLILLHQLLTPGPFRSCCRFASRALGRPWASLPSRDLIAERSSASGAGQWFNRQGHRAPLLISLG